MRVAALYDIHGNLPALEAVLGEVRRVGVERIVVGGDVLPGPMPRETIAALTNLEIPVTFIHGNGDLAVLAQAAAPDPASVTYWGSTSGEPLPEPLQEALRWTARQLTPEDRRLVASWPKTLSLESRDLGLVLFCHGTPRGETEIFTRLTPEDRLVPIFDDANASVVVCGHTHMQFDRMVGRTRVVNAGSVGMPFGEPGAYWLLLGPGVELRSTSYDLRRAADRIRATAYPQAREFADGNVLKPPSEQSILDVFGHAELRPHDRVSFELQPTLVGELVELRSLQAEDYDALYEVAADPLIWEQHPVPNRHEEAVFQQFFRDALASGGALLATDVSSRRVIGSSRFHAYDSEKSEVEIGWTFLARSHWGGRYNGEMKRLMLQHAFRFVSRVIFLVGVHNVRSQRAVERIGGVRTGSRRDAAGTDSHVYEITARSFASRNDHRPTSS